MEKLKIKSGSKITTMLIINGEYGKEMKSSFEKNVSDSSILITIPIVDGKRAVVGDMQPLLIKYSMDGVAYAVEGYIDDVVKQGVRQYWRVRKTSEVREFFQRTDVRVKARLNITFVKIWWDAHGQIQEDESIGMSEDISAGGLAFYENTPLTVGEIITVNLPGQGKKKGLSGRSEVCWVRSTEPGNAFKHMVGLRFIFENQGEKEKVAAYVASIPK